MSTRREIEDCAEQVLRQYWDRTIPVDIASIAKKYGAKILPLSAKTKNDPSLQYNTLSGLAEKNEYGCMIYVSETDHYNRQRFTVAHELGHIVLGHTDEGVMKRDDYKNYSIGVWEDLHEIEANQFAAAILIPENALINIITKNNIRSINDLAVIFNVSSTAMYWRLKNLGVSLE